MIRIILIVWFTFVTYLYLTPCVIIKKDNQINKIIKESFQVLCSYVYKYGLNYNLYCNKNIIKTKDKVDILIVNHIDIYDIFLILYILKCQNIKKFIFVGKKEIIYIPGFGLHFISDNHIKLTRKWEEDKLILDQQIDQLEDEVIILFPEGTRFSSEKLKDGQKFSKENNLPVYDNLLVPKSKGLYAMYNRLIKNNKLGKIYDMSMIYKKKDIYIINRELEYEDTKDFKTWLLEEWKEKDILMTYYENVEYKELSFQHERIILILNLLIIATISYQLYKNKYFRIYGILSILVAYLYILSS